MQAPADGVHRPSPVAPAPSRLEYEGVDGSRIIAEDPETGHYYAVDCRRQQQLGPIFGGRWRKCCRLMVAERPREWTDEATETALRTQLVPAFELGKVQATWLHLSVLDRAPACPGCMSAHPDRVRRTREVAHAG